MTGPDFRQRLAELGLRQVGLVRLVERLSGQQIAATTVWRWCAGETPVPPLAVAVLELYARLDDQAREALA